MSRTGVNAYARTSGSMLATLIATFGCLRARRYIRQSDGDRSRCIGSGGACGSHAQSWIGCCAPPIQSGVDEMKNEMVERRTDQWAEFDEKCDSYEAITRDVQCELSENGEPEIQCVGLCNLCRLRYRECAAWDFCTTCTVFSDFILAALGEQQLNKEAYLLAVFGSDATAIGDATPVLPPICRDWFSDWVPLSEANPGVFRDAGGTYEQFKAAVVARYLEARRALLVLKGA